MIAADLAKVAKAQDGDGGEDITNTFAWTLVALLTVISGGVWRRMRRAEPLADELAQACESGGEPEEENSPELPWALVEERDGGTDRCSRISDS